MSLKASDDVRGMWQWDREWGKSNRGSPSSSSSFETGGRSKQNLQ